MDLLTQVKHFGKGGTVENPVALIRDVVSVLEQVRELHKPFVVRTPDDETWHECETCHGNLWPCQTARLVYADDEEGLDTAKLVRRFQSDWIEPT